MDVCCLQEVRWRGQGPWFRGMKLKGRRYKLWWSGNSDGMRGVVGAVREGCGGAMEEQQNDDSSDGT